MSSLRSSKVWVPAVWGLWCAIVTGWTLLDPIPTPTAAAPSPVPGVGAEGRALLGGLQPGDRLVGWTVQSIDGPRDGALRIDVARDGVSFALMVVAKDRHPELPPVQTERHAIFYGHVDPPGTHLPDNTIRAITHELARRVGAHEGTTTVPGL